MAISPNDAPLRHNIMMSYYKLVQAAEKNGTLDAAKVDCSRCISIGNDAIRIDATKPEYWEVRAYCQRIMRELLGTPQH